MSIDEINLAYVKNAGEAKGYLSRGYEPVECSFGEFGTVVGPLILDHHGKYSHEDPVSIKAFKLASDPSWVPLKNFLVTGMADPDAVYTILALSKKINPDLSIAKSIGELDVDPIGIDRMLEPYIRVPAFEMQYEVELSKEGYRDALKIGVLVFDNFSLDNGLEERARNYERDRIDDIKRKITFSKEDVIFLERDGPSRDVGHLEASLIVQYKPTLKVLTLSGLSERGARITGRRSIYEIFGQGGLKSIYPEVGNIVGKGIGGREEIGGGPRHIKISREKALEVFDLVVYLSSLNKTN